MKVSRRIAVGVGIAVTLLVGGCSSTTRPDQSALNNDDFYEVHHEGRIYVFDDSDTYLSFLEVGETAYRKVRIGEGPMGETVVFGLARADKNKRSGIAGIDMWDGSLQTSVENFYAELLTDDRFYVFSAWKDLQEFKEVGEAIYRYTDIGAGPDGKTVVYVLNKDNKKQKPEQMISRFQFLHGAKPL